MDPNLFHLDWERTAEALAAVIVLSFIVERVCALLFESRWWIHTFEDRRVETGAQPEAAAPVAAQPGPGHAGRKPAKVRGVQAARRFPLKEIISFAIALFVCRGWGFDALSIILLAESTSAAGMIMTAAVIAGGSKASIALFHNVMNVRSNASRELEELKIVKNED